MVKFLILFVLLLTSCNFFSKTQTSNVPLEKEINVLDPDNINSVVKSGNPAIGDELFQKVANDVNKKVPDFFRPEDFFKTNVFFWMAIYSQYSTDHRVIHDAENLDFVYKILDFSSLPSDGLTAYARDVIINTYTQENIQGFIKDLKSLASGLTANKQQEELLHRFTKSSNPPPENPKEREIYFLKKVSVIRSQSGQRNVIEKGLYNYFPYSAWIEQFLILSELPLELRSVPFLESSFNPRAESKVAALGVWQFMPLIASYFMPKKNKNLDYRKSVILSTVAASHLLRENFKILKNWDLAVTAYNSGTKHLVNARKVFNNKNVSLAEIIQKYEHAHLGFASKNFYTEFIALVHVLAYKDEIFDITYPGTEMNWKTYVSLCQLNFKTLHKTYPDFLENNPQFKSEETNYPRGSLVVYPDLLPKGRFFEITMEVAKKLKPKDWETLIKRQSCSTK